MLELRSWRIPDPTGHNERLLLKGDWVILEVSDGACCGRGEASHSGSDKRVIDIARALFQKHIRKMDLNRHSLLRLEQESFVEPTSFVEATAISALNQALCELLAQRNAIPAWKLFADSKQREAVETYATINRALTSQTPDEYIRVARKAMEQGFRAIKCAPFDAVTNDGDQVRQSQQGLHILRRLRDRFPDLSIRVDFHERFRLREFLEVLPKLESLELHWLEAPIPIGRAYAELAGTGDTPIALGELLFGIQGFSTIVDSHWAEVIMPDVKHVGGFGPLMRLARYYESAVEISPHNPSGPIAALASAHTCIAQRNIGALELPFIADPARAYYSDWLSDGFVTLPSEDGWGCRIGSSGID